MIPVGLLACAGFRLGAFWKPLSSLGMLTPRPSFPILWKHSRSSFLFSETNFHVIPHSARTHSSQISLRNFVRLEGMTCFSCICKKIERLPYSIFARTNFLRRQMQLMRIELQLFHLKKVSVHKKSGPTAKFTHRGTTYFCFGNLTVLYIEVSWLFW